MKEEGAMKVHIGELGTRSKRTQVVALKPDEIQELRELGRRKRIILEYEAAGRTNHTHEMLCRLTQIPAYTVCAVDQ